MCWRLVGSKFTLQQPVNPRFQPNIEPSHTVIEKSKFAVDKIALGARISFKSSNYKEYKCRLSDQFEGFTWCQKRRTERVSRGSYLSSYTILHSQDGSAYYLNRELKPAFFNPGEINSDIDRLSRKFGGQPHLISMPRGKSSLSGIIASWGEAVLEPLDANAISELAAGRSPRKGILLDFVRNFQQSVHQALPVYRLTGGAGFVWAASFDASGRGTLRFFAIDPSALSETPPEGIEPKPRPPQ